MEWGTGKILYRSAVRSARHPLKEKKKSKADGEQQITTKDNTSHSKNYIFSAQDITDGLDISDETTSYGEPAYQQ